MDLYFPEQHIDHIVDALNKFTSDTCEHKINCTFGVLNDAHDDLYKFRCIRKAERMLLAEDLSYSYLSSIGNEEYVKLSTELYFGNDTHYYGVQTIGGTGSLYLAGQFINVTFKNLGKNIWIPNSTWDNHVHIFQNQGIEVKRYVYLEDNEFNFSTMYESIYSIPDYNIVLFHGCCHNPTGYDLTPTQWDQIIELCKLKNLYIVVDFAYLGFASGLIETDKYVLSLLNKTQIPSIVCTSYSKAFGIYSERTGMLFVTGKDKQESAKVIGLLNTIIRTTYCSPQTYGSRLITKILSVPSLKEEWLSELKEIHQRHVHIRQTLRTKLEERLNLDFSDITQQKGLFWYSKKHLSDKQIEYIISEHVYIIKSGRINISSLNGYNIDRFADVFVSAIQIIK